MPGMGAFTSFTLRTAPPPMPMDSRSRSKAVEDFTVQS